MLHRLVSASVSGLIRAQEEIAWRLGYTGRVERSENHPSVLSSPRSGPDAKRAGGTETVGHTGPEPTVKPTVMG